MTYQKLREKLVRNSTIQDTAILTESKIYGKKDMISTSIPIINIALSGRIDGGLAPGLTVIAGESKRFKTSFLLFMAAAYLKKYDDAIILFYDSEFGTPESYVSMFDIDPERIVHTPITDIQVFKHDIMNQLDGVTREDHVIILVDSIGVLASRKEVEDARSGNDAEDMTRAKKLKSLFRIITPHLTIKDVPMIAVNHIYMTQEMYSKAQVSGGSGPYLAADDIWIIGRQTDTEGTGKDKSIEGYKFIINVDKSRFVKEKSKFPVSISYDEGIGKWSGLFELALEGGYIKSPTKGWYVVPSFGGRMDNKRRSEIENSGEFWRDLIKNTDFPEWIQKTYSLGVTKMVSDNEILELE
jgi:hypothetical protein